MRFLSCFLLFIFNLGLAQDSTENPLQKSIALGGKLYGKHCVICHKKDGTGKGKRIPPLAQSDFLLNNITKSIKGIKYGQEGPITVNGIVYDRVMKAQKLTDAEIADVMNYILNSWGNTHQTRITKEEVANALAN